MNEPQGGYGLLARLRDLERELRALRGDWRSFRDRPSPRTLSDLKQRSAAFKAALDALSAGVEHPAVGGDRSFAGVQSHPTERPEPREVVRASRDIDAMIWEATRGWRDVLEGDVDENLESIASALRRAGDRAATLIVALGGAVIRTASGLSAPGVRGTGPEESIERLASELEGMLWKIQADWQYMRKGPTPDRLHLLMDSLRATATSSSDLLEISRSVGSARFRRAIRLGRQLNEGIRFLPYRDPFTGAYNREGFDSLAEAELKRCRRYGRSFGLLSFEVSPPNLPGLQRLVATVRAELREYDLVARYVDDLILIGVPEGGPGPTRRVASRVLRALRAEGMASWLRRLSYATLPEDGATLSGLIRATHDRLQP